MSARDVLARVPAILSRRFAQSAAQWRAVVSTGTYVPLTDAHQGPVSESFVFDADRQREVLVQQCILTVPFTSAEIPAHGQVKTADGLEWGIVARSPNTQHGLMAYTLRRDPLVRFTPDRKATP